MNYVTKNRLHQVHIMQRYTIYYICNIQ